MMSNNQLDNISELEKYIILLLHINENQDSKPDNSPINGKTRFQIVMYMIGDSYKEIREQSNYIINNGIPYSSILDNKLKDLIQMNLVVIDNYNNIKLSNKGSKYAKIITKEIDKNKLLNVYGDYDKITKVLSDYKEFVNNITHDELLSYVYSAYPETINRSTTYQKLEPHIEDHIFALLERRKFSSGRTAELLDQPLHIVMEKMIKRRILVLEP